MPNDTYSSFRRCEPTRAGHVRKWDWLPFATPTLAASTASRPTSALFVCTPRFASEPENPFICNRISPIPEPNEPKVRSYSAEHQRVRTSPVQVPPQEDVGMPE